MAKTNKPLLVLFVTIFLDLLGFGIVIPILPIFARELGASGFLIGLIAGSYSLMQFGFATFWGGLSDRIGRRPVILISIGIMAVSYLFFGFATSIGALLVARVLAGIGAANLSAAQAYISDISTPENRTKNFGLIGAAFGLGFIFGPPIGGFIKEHYSIEWVGYFTMLLCVGNFVLAYFALPESITAKNKTAAILTNPARDILLGLKRKTIRELLTVNFIFISAMSMMHVTATLMWVEHYDFSEAEVGYVFAYIGFLAVLIQGGLIGWFNRKFGDYNLLIIGNIAMCIGLTFLPFVPPKWFIPLALLLLLFISFGNSFLTPTINALISDNAANHEKGKLLGTNQSLGSLARVVGPILGGTLYGIQFQIPYVVSGAIMILSGVLSYRMIALHRSQEG
ncbi:MAG: MFS transporter [Schleiferiaceae bacterium]|nr:MFS transporter [Schleiferiaceae bacterium]